LSMLYAHSESLPLPLRLKGGLAFAELYKFYDREQAEALVQLLARLLPLVDDAEVTFWFYAVSGWVATFCKSWDVANERWNTGLVLARQQGAKRWEAEYLTDLGVVARDQDDYARSELLLHEAVQLSRTINDLYQLGEGLFWLTTLMLFNLGDYARARQYVQQCIGVVRAFGNRRTLALATEYLGYLLLEEGDVEQAERHFRDALALGRIQGNLNVVSRVLYCFSRLSYLRGDFVQAEQLLNEITFAKAYIVHVPYYAQQQLLLGHIRRVSGDLPGAMRYYQASLMAYQANTFAYGTALALEPIATLAAMHGEPLQSALFGGAAESIRQTTTEPVLEMDRFAPMQTTIADQVNQPSQEEWERAWQSGTSLAWDEATTQALAWLEKRSSEYPVVLNTGKERP
jgi:tetratricopeptide (TPR) repeat protein